MVLDCSLLVSISMFEGSTHSMTPYLLTYTEYEPQACSLLTVNYLHSKSYASTFKLRGRNTDIALPHTEQKYLVVHYIFPVLQ